MARSDPDQSLAAAEAELDQLGGGGAAPAPIGVPEGYVPPVQYAQGFPDVSQVGRGTSLNYVENWQPTWNDPYVDGDEWRPTNTPEAIPALQAALANAGLLNIDNIRPGVWDETSRNAYKNALELANQYGITVQQALQLLANNPTFKQMRGRGGGGGGMGIRRVNEDDLRAVANQVAPTILGRRFNDTEIGQFIAAWRGMENTGSPPQVDTAVEKIAGEVAPVEKDAHALADTYGMFLQMIGAPRG